MLLWASLLHYFLVDFSTAIQVYLIYIIYVYIHLQVSVLPLCGSTAMLADALPSAGISAIHIFIPAWILFLNIPKSYSGSKFGVRLLSVWRLLQACCRGEGRWSQVRQFITVKNQMN